MVQHLWEIDPLGGNSKEETESRVTNGLITNIQTLLKTPELKPLTQDQCIQWINPAAVIVPYHPHDLLQLFGHNRVEWDETIDFACYLPIHLKGNGNNGNTNGDNNNIKQLIYGYVRANFAEVDPACHMSTYIINHFQKNKETITCFRATFNDNTNKITLQTCSSDNGNNEIETYDGEHYKDIFKLCKEIIFIPHRILCRRQQKSGGDNGLYEQYMVGTYVGVTSQYNNNFCQDESIRRLLEQVSEVMYLKARQKAHGKLKDALRSTVAKLDKYHKMLALLMNPLENLTQALEEMQADAQNLRAVLYEPSNAIFAAAPRVTKYFTEGATVGEGGLTWKSLHNYVSTAKGIMPVAKQTLAALILEIFGKTHPWPENAGALIHRASACLLDTDPSFEELRSQMRLILGTPDIFFLEDNEATEKYCQAITFLKNILHYPYKEGGDIYWAPFLLVVSGVDSHKKIFTFFNKKNKSLYDIWKDFAHAKIEIYQKKFSIPVPRYAHWLAFIQGVVAYAASDKNAQIEQVLVSMSEEEEEKTLKITIKFKEKIFTENLQETFDKMKECAGKSDELRYLGNFQRPFIEFAMRTTGENHTSEKNTYTIEHDGNKTQITLDGDSFCYSFTTGDGKEGSR